MLLYSLLQQFLQQKVDIFTWPKDPFPINDSIS